MDCVLRAKIQCMYVEPHCNTRYSCYVIGLQGSECLSTTLKFGWSEPIQFSNTSVVHVCYEFIVKVHEYPIYLFLGGSTWIDIVVIHISKVWERIHCVLTVIIVAWQVVNWTDHLLHYKKYMPSSIQYVLEKVNTWRIQLATVYVYKYCEKSTLALLGNSADFHVKLLMSALFLSSVTSKCTELEKWITGICVKHLC